MDKQFISPQQEGCAQRVSRETETGGGEGSRALRHKGREPQVDQGLRARDRESACPIAGGVMRRDDSGLTIAGWGIWRDQGGSKAPQKPPRQ